jgi:hypothetical protein
MEQLEQHLNLVDKIENNILTRTDITSIEYEVMTVLVTGEQPLSKPHLVMDLQQSNDEVWFKTMSSHGLFDKEMADKIEWYLFKNGAQYTRDDRHFYVNNQDFFRLFGEC